MTSMAWERTVDVDGIEGEDDDEDWGESYRIFIPGISAKPRCLQDQEKVGKPELCSRDFYNNLDASSNESHRTLSTQSTTKDGASVIRSQSTPRGREWCTPSALRRVEQHEDSLGFWDPAAFCQIRTIPKEIVLNGTSSYASTSSQSCNSQQSANMQNYESKSTPGMFAKRKELTAVLLRREYMRSNTMGHIHDNNIQQHPQVEDELRDLLKSFRDNCPKSISDTMTSSPAPSQGNHLIQKDSKQLAEQTSDWVSSCMAVKAVGAGALTALALSSVRRRSPESKDQRTSPSEGDFSSVSGSECEPNYYESTMLATKTTAALVGPYEEEDETEEAGGEHDDNSQLSTKSSESYDTFYDWHSDDSDSSGKATSEDPCELHRSSLSLEAMFNRSISKEIISYGPQSVGSDAAIDVSHASCSKPSTRIHEVEVPRLQGTHKAASMPRLRDDELSHPLERGLGEKSVTLKEAELRVLLKHMRTDDLMSLLQSMRVSR